ncbi:Pimeloyl-ACP methyl ester carboxylesterase [Zobellia uliginosa]|uniref:Pimeloyl-ACP methyl ester carboxylesterase n=1 Tax=Zobellia uliginosa TaxID=143224 RepID=A0ABN1RSQ1_9FLAO|nr:alpha/beta hydrolase [Zobellia uliginosa]SIS42784.1 Pimeloyl-ACP methyl ester carboxylesterase [Zobellia uliginosa]
MKTYTGLKYEKIGKGKKAIVFVHYFGGDAGSWHWLAKRLRKRYTCILLNLPGFGGTKPLAEPSIYGMAQYINLCLDELKLKDYILCGHSMGAKLVLYAAQLKKGNLADKLLLIAPSPPTVEDMADDERQRMLKHPDREEAAKTVRGATKKKMGKKRSLYAVNSQLRIDGATWQWWLKGGMKNNIAERIKGLDIPTTVIFSKDDPVIATEAIYNEVLPHLCQPSTVTLSRVGHLIPMEMPRKLARIIKKWDR